MTMTLNGTNGVTFPSGHVSNGIVLPAKISTTSGTVADFTGLPTVIRKIRVLFSGVSTNGTTNLSLQIGNGTVETSGYTSAATQLNPASNTTASSTTGFVLTGSNTAASLHHGIAELELMESSSNLWVFSSSLWNSGASVPNIAAGSKAIAAALTILRLTAGGTDTFDAGSISIQYE